MSNDNKATIKDSLKAQNDDKRTSLGAASGSATVDAYFFDPSKEAPFPFLEIGVGHGTPIRIGDASGKVVGFRDAYTATVEFGLSTLDLPLEGFL